MASINSGIVSDAAPPFRRRSPAREGSNSPGVLRHASPVAIDSISNLSLSIAETLNSVEDDWRALEERALISPYQDFDLMRAWTDHAAKSEGFSVRVGIVRNAAGRVVIILPFGLLRKRGATVGEYLGGRHFNLNMPLVDPEVRLDRAAAGSLFDRYCKATCADVLLLRNQPEHWQGVRHPFLCRPHQEAADGIRLIVVDTDFPDFFRSHLSGKVRSELRRKSARLEAAGMRSVICPTTPEQVDALLTTFLAQKAQRFTTWGIDNPFDRDGVEEFLRIAAYAGLSGEGGVQIHALGGNGRLLAVRAGARKGNHMSCMIQSFDADDDLARYSPSELLLQDVLSSSCAEGVVSFDFGVGDTRFKRVWANSAIKLFNTTHAATMVGRLQAVIATAGTAAKRHIKRSPRLYAALQDARAKRARLFAGMEV